MVFHMAAPNPSYKNNQTYQNPSISIHARFSDKAGKSNAGIGQDDAIAASIAAKKPIINIFEGRAILSRREEPDALKDVFPINTGIYVAHVQPGMTFRESNLKDDGAYALFYDEKSAITYRFPIPADYRDMKDCLCALPMQFNGQEPSYEMSRPSDVGGRTEKELLVGHEDNIAAIPDFPSKYGFFNIEDSIGMASGPRLEDEMDRSPCYLLRHQGAYNGLVVVGEYLNDWPRYLWPKYLTLEASHADKLGLILREDARVPALGAEPAGHPIREANASYAHISG